MIEPNLDRLRVGARPLALAAARTADPSELVVANELSDSLSWVDLRARKVVAEVSLGPRPAPSSSDRGERLFFDARLSHDGWLSCHSCHTDGHSTGLLNDNFTDGTFGTPKRVLSLLGSGDTAPYAWNGSMPDLETQIKQSVTSTMRGKSIKAEDVKDLAAFLRTLPPPPPLSRLRGEVESAAIARGQEVFRSQGCSRCHTPPFFTSPGTYNVGIPDEAGLTKFNPPSLRGVSQGGPYFHNNSALTLRDVLAVRKHQLMSELSQRQLDDLVSYLQSL
jgi:cytochrome c peroxidase